MIKFGLIGAGRIAHAFAASIKVTDAKLVAVASRDEKKALVFKEQYNLEKAYGSYEELYNDETINCIYVATPHGLHYEQMLDIIKASKHILCEKAFTLNHKQALDVFKKAKAKNLFVMEAMWTRFLPVIKKVKALIKEGIIGKVETLEACFHFNPEKNERDRLFNPKLGGGALLDIGIYPITLANLILGEPKQIKSKVKRFKTGVDLEETITYHYGHAVAYLSASLDKPEKREAIIKGTKGHIFLPHFWAAEKALVYDEHNQLIKTIEQKHQVMGFEYEINEVIDCLKKGKQESDIMPHKTTIAILKQMDGLRKTWGLSYPQE